jgi:hypothetical protein
MIFMSDWDFLNKNRVRRGQWGSDETYGFNGMFEFALTGEARRIRCIASDGAGWRHVSVSFGAVSKSAPSWDLMCKIKDLFWDDEDCVVQFHPPKSEYVNNHAGCLHLWQKIDGSQPIPNSLLVGYKGVSLEIMKDLFA